MYGCFVTEPEDDGADLGVVFFHNAGYSTACGHGTIALVTWAIESRPSSRGPEVVVDVPSGRLPTVARVEDGRVVSVRFRNVPVVRPRARARGRRAQRSTSRSAARSTPRCAERVEPGELPRLIELGRAIKADLERDHEIVHPREPELRDVYGVIFWQEEGEDPLTQRNVTVFADGEVDRSPCGSGTSARLALLHDEGRLGDRRAAAPPAASSAASSPAASSRRPPSGVVTEVEGSAHLTGRHEFVLDPDDELGEGFLLR